MQRAGQRSFGRQLPVVSAAAGIATAKKREVRSSPTRRRRHCGSVLLVTPAQELSATALQALQAWPTTQPERMTAALTELHTGSMASWQGALRSTGVCGARECTVVLGAAREAGGVATAQRLPLTNRATGGLAGTANEPSCLHVWLGGVAVGRGRCVRGGPLPAPPLPPAPPAPSSGKGGLGERAVP